MCYSPYPTVNYGQNKGAYNPSTRSDMYQQVQRAQKDAGFAQQFAADILFGQPGTGEHGSTRYWTWETRDVGIPDAPDYKTSFVRKETRNGYLHNRNSLNASQSWVAQAFNAPAMRLEDGSWRRAEAVVNNNDSKKGTQFGFKAGSAITDAQTIRMLNEGHYAFKASGYDGSEVYVPWSQGYVPRKGQEGRPETRNSKNQTVKQNTTPERGMVSPSTAEPANVIAGKNLLGTDKTKKHLLG